MGGMTLPGLMACASMIQPPRFPAVLATVPAPIVLRLPKCVRSGPTAPLAPVPAMVWHAAHAEERNTCRPCSSVASVGTAGTCAAACSHARKSLGERAIT